MKASRFFFIESASQTSHSLPALVWPAARERQQTEREGSHPIQRQPFQQRKGAILCWYIDTTGE